MKLSKIKSKTHFNYYDAAIRILNVTKRPNSHAISLPVFLYTFYHNIEPNDMQFQSTFINNKIHFKSLLVYYNLTILLTVGSQYNLNK